VSRLTQALASKRVVICAGAGGVGKTTVSAAVALGLAIQGRRVALVTIDPARRLAEALGLDALDNRPQPVALARLEESGKHARGELFAMMLDSKRTFDELIELLAPDPRTKEQILANPIYGHISTAVAGSQEYTAIAKLFEIEHAHEYDVIVLDTPPSRHAIEFLEAPDRLTGFLEGRALNVLLRPSGRAMRAAGIVFAALRRITGVALLDDLTTLFRLLAGLLDGFRRRAADVEALLGDPGTGFLIIASPEQSAVDEAVFFAAELARAGFHRCGVIVNRVHPLDSETHDAVAVAARLHERLGPKLAGKVARTHVEVQRLAARDAGAVARLLGALGDDPICLPDRDTDVHDIASLVDLCTDLFAG